MNPFDVTRLGSTDVWVTRLGLGMAPIGGLYTKAGDEQARATVAAAWDVGIRYFDTAPLYGNGLSERRAGAVLRDKPRGEFTLSTKAGRRLALTPVSKQDTWADPGPDATHFDFTAAGTLASYQESLARLGLERVDVLHIHDPDDHFEEALAGSLVALTRLRAEGSIGAVSAGMNQAPMLADFVRTGQLDCVRLAGRYTLLDQSGFAELLPLCAARGVSVVIGGAYNSGILADPRPGATYDYAPASATVLDRTLAIRDVCARHDVPLRAAALQFPYGHPAVASVIVGARSPEEMRDAVAMASYEIPGQLWRDLKRAGLLPEDVMI
jgi:D-threo-aldose 1-dehydrogenase